MLAAAATVLSPPVAEVPGQAPASEPPSFEVVYERWFDFVWRSVRRLGVGEPAVDDVVQDVFVIVHRRLHTFEGRSSVKTWLYGITRRVVRDHRRSRARKRPHEPLRDSVPDLGTCPMQEAARAQAVRVLHEILDQLDDDKREVFMLAELEQLSVPEIADALGANLNTVYSRLRAARHAFERALSRHQARDAFREVKP